MLKKISGDVLPDSYKICRVCKKEVEYWQEELARQIKYPVICSGECHEKETVRNHGCCSQAKLNDCVCMFYFTCPIHGERRNA